MRPGLAVTGGKMIGADQGVRAVQAVQVFQAVQGVQVVSGRRSSVRTFMSSGRA